MEPSKAKKTNQFNRPDERALLRVLEENRGKCVEVIIRLAWNAGMNTTEMRELKWEQISFAENQRCISLPNRTIPLEGDLLKCLQNWDKELNWYRWHKKEGQRREEYVVVTDSRRTRPVRGVMSRFVSAALKEEGLENTTIEDLRKDFIIRLLEQHDLPYVARISGLQIHTLNHAYSPYVRPESKSREKARSKVLPDDETMISVVKAEGVPLGIAIWFSWNMKLTFEEIVQLTWDQIELDARTILLPSRYIFIDETLRELLDQAQAERDPDGDPHVILTPKSKKPFRGDRLSRVVRAALIRRGMETAFLTDMKTLRRWKEEEERIVNLAKQKKNKNYITANEIQRMLGLSEMNVFRCMQRIQEQGKLIKVGRRYYLPGTVVPPEQQYESIRAYLEEKGSAGYSELVQLLGIERRQGQWVLNGLIKEGKLLRIDHQYMLPQNTEE